MARLFIGGTFRGADKVEPVIEAAAGDPLGDGSAATESEIDDAVAAARSALDVWRSTPASQRADALNRFADALRTGTIGVNDYQLDIAAPFGGVKASGVGASSARTGWPPI